MKKQIVILTISDKHNDKYNSLIPEEEKKGGYCIAGFEVGKFDEWIRLIGVHEKFKITNDEAMYEDGRLCEPFDVIEVDCMRMTEEFWSMGMAHGWGEEGSPWLNFIEYNEELLAVQPENYIAEGRFTFIKKMMPEDFFSVCRFYDRPYIFTNAWSSLTVPLAIENSHSLALVKVSELELLPVEIRSENGETGYQNHYKASFVYNGIRYSNITVTDPDYEVRENNYEAMDLDDCAIIMSLGEKYPQNAEKGRHYKLIAKIFEEYETEADTVGGVMEDEDIYPFEGALGLNACINKLKELFDVTDSSYNGLMRKKILAMLEEQGFVYQDHGTKPTEYGLEHGLFWQQAVTQKGESYVGLFFDREPQELIYSYVPTCLEEIRSELEERHFTIRGERINAVFHGNEISFKKRFSDHVFTTDELNRLIDGETICINYNNGNKSCRGRLMQRTGEYGVYYAFTPDFDEHFSE